MFDPASWGTAFGGLMADMSTSGFWVGVAQIIWVDIILAGDNAVVIALACRNLPPSQRAWGIALGTGVAVLLRVFFTLIVTQMMMLSFVKMVGGVALFYIALKLVTEEEEKHGENNVKSSTHLWQAVRTVAVADVVMSLDNVLGIAGVANGHGGSQMALIIFGLLVSIPLVVAGAQAIMALLSRYPILVWAGGALLGWVAGQVIATDPVVKGLFSQDWAHRVEIMAVILGAAAVVVVGLMKRRYDASNPA